MYIAPLHYYGDEAAFDAQQNSFGFQKGDLEKIRTLNAQPLGAGPYRLVSYQNGAVSYEANEHYYLGTPKARQLRLEYQNIMDQLVTGTLDFCWLPSGYHYGAERKNLTFVPIQDIADTYYRYIGLNPRTVNVAGGAGQ